jgi:hypothetical protein
MKPEKTEGRVSDPTRGCGLCARDPVLTRASPLSQLCLLFPSSSGCSEVVPDG